MKRSGVYLAMRLGIVVALGVLAIVDPLRGLAAAAAIRLLPIIFR